MPRLRHVSLIGLRFHASGAGARQTGQAMLRELPETAAQRFAPAPPSRLVAA